MVRVAKPSVHHPLASVVRGDLQTDLSEPLHG
jgi:hypothetical protein